MTPAGVVCPKRKNTKPLPNPASAFHFTAETLSFGSNINIIGFVKEWYDFDLNLVQYDLSSSQFGPNPVTVIHDFNTGVAYIVDKVTGQCQTNPISSDSFDVTKVDAQTVRIRTAREFYYFDRASYTYEGTKSVRDLLTDVWIATRPNNDYSVNTTWEWYFLSPDYNPDLPDKLQFGMPVMMTMTDTNGRHFVYNIYDYDERRPPIWEFDISKCFNYTQKRDFSFRLKGSYRQAVSSNMRNFKDATIRAITSAGSVNGLQPSGLRINNIQIDYADNNDIIVSFTLLDKAPITGDVQKAKPENDLNTVATSISRQINGGQFIIKLRVSDTNIFSVVATPYSLTNTQHVIKHSYYTQQQKGSVTSTGVSGGAMAGMGVALLVVFFILGVLGTYLFYRHQGGAFLPKKFDNTDITQDDS